MNAFTKLMREAQDKGCTFLSFACWLERTEEDYARWEASALRESDGDDHPIGHGRTGEEALRCLVGGLK